VVDFGESQITQLSNDATAGKLTVAGIACAKLDGRVIAVKVQLVHRVARDVVLWEGEANQMTSWQKQCQGHHAFNVILDIADLVVKGMPSDTATGTSILDLDMMAIAETGGGAVAVARIPLNPFIVVDTRLRNLANPAVSVGCDQELNSSPALQEVIPPEMSDCQLVRYNTQRQLILPAQWQTCTWGDQSPDEKRASAKATLQLILGDTAAKDATAMVLMLAKIFVAAPCESIDLEMTESTLCTKAKVDQLYTVTSLAGSVCSVICENIVGFKDGGRRLAREESTQGDSATLSLVVVGLAETIVPKTFDSVPSTALISLMSRSTVMAAMEYSAAKIVISVLNLKDIEAQAASISWRAQVANALSSYGDIDPPDVVEASNNNNTTDMPPTDIVSSAVGSCHRRRFPEFLLSMWALMVALAF
jgi:hypothetical protein